MDRWSSPRSRYVRASLTSARASTPDGRQPGSRRIWVPLGLPVVASRDRRSRPYVNGCLMQLNDRQIAEHVTHGGFTGQDRVIGVAVVLAESGGRTDASGDVHLQDGKWGPSIGLFQIRSLRRSGAPAGPGTSSRTWTQ